MPPCSASRLALQCLSVQCLLEPSRAAPHACLVSRVLVCQIHGVDASSWDGSLKMAERKLRECAAKVVKLSAQAEQAGAEQAASGAAAGASGACAKAVAAAGAAQTEFDSWSKLIFGHPE